VEVNEFWNTCRSVGTLARDILGVIE